MSETSHWPFSSDAGTQGTRGSNHPRDAAGEHARSADKAALRERMRYDRLIVGGRAHTKKHGLS